MKALITAIILSFALPAFALEGTLKVTQDSLRIQRDDGFKVNFYKGNYPASLTFKNARAYLYITRKDIRTEATLKFPAGASIPENGSFVLDGTKTGQTFLISGNIATTRSETPTVREQESCQYERDEYVCRGYGRNRYCQWETVIYEGLRRVEYHYLTKTVKLATQLNSDNGGTAEFGGTEVARSKVYTDFGPCY